MARHHHQGAAIRARIDGEAPLDAGEARVVVALVLHRAIGDLQAVQGRAVARCERRDVGAARAGDPLGGRGRVLADVHAAVGDLRDVPGALGDGLLVAVDDADVLPPRAGVHEEVVVDPEPAGADDVKVVAHHEVIDVRHRSCGGVLDGNDAKLAESLLDRAEHPLEGVEEADLRVAEELVDGNLLIGPLHSLACDKGLLRKDGGWLASAAAMRPAISSLLPMRRYSDARAASMSTLSSTAA